MTCTEAERRVIEDWLEYELPFRITARADRAASADAGVAG